jgi:hypothetical protein
MGPASRGEKYGLGEIRDYNKEREVKYPAVSENPTRCRKHV